MLCECEKCWSFLEVPFCLHGSLLAGKRDVSTQMETVTLDFLFFIFRFPVFRLLKEFLMVLRVKEDSLNKGNESRIDPICLNFRIVMK